MERITASLRKSLALFNPSLHLRFPGASPMERCTTVEVNWRSFYCRSFATGAVDVQSGCVDGNRNEQFLNQINSKLGLSSEVTKRLKTNILENTSVEPKTASIWNEETQVAQFQNGVTTFIASSSDTVNRVCSLVCQCYEDGDRRLQSLQIGYDLSPEQATTVVAMLVEREGSVVGMSFFNRVIAHVKFRYFMRFYIIVAGSLLNRGNLEKGQEVMRCMITSFTEIGKFKEAVDMVFEMKNQGLALSIHTLNWVLRIAVDLDDINFAERLFFEMSANMVSPDSRSFKAMIIAYSRKGRIADVERLLKEMLRNGIHLDNTTCTVVVNALCEMGYSSKVHGIFEKMFEWGVPPNVVNYTALIDRLCKRGSVKQAFQVLEEMVGRGMKPNVYTHTSLIDGLCKIGWTEKAFRLFLKLVRSDLYKPNVHTYTAMIGGYCKENKMNRAEMLLSRMQEQGLSPNTTTFTTLIDGHCKEGNLDQAFELMDQMRGEGCLPNICTYNVIVYGLLKKRRVEEAYNLLKIGCEQGLQPDKITYTILIGEHCKQGDITLALDLFYQMFKYGFLPDIHTYTTLITTFCKQRKMDDSKKLFDEALGMGLIPTKLTFTAMISGYCRDANVSAAIDLFEKMAKHGCLADSVTYGGLISGLCKESRLEEACALHNAMMDKGLTPCEVTCITLTYEYCKKNAAAVAVEILNRLDKRLWIRIARILIRKLSSEGLVDPAALFFSKLLEKDENIDHITYVAFVNACYDNGKYSIVADLSKRISSAIGNLGTQETDIT